jgi:putative Holliday junction resolvase
MEDFSFYPNYITFSGKKILAIDYGSKVVGTAMYSPGLDPFPYVAQKIIYQNDESTVLGLKKIIEDEGVDVIVLGVPFFIDGKESKQTQKVRAFGELLKKQCPNQIYFEQDETLTTKAAEERMKTSPQYNFKVDMTKIDCVSAMIILEDFIKS